ncbi:PAS domain S-box protein, partial [Devosia riboflavina]
TQSDDVLAPDPRDWLAAIIEGSEDAIVSKNLNGIIQTWNAGASRLFGYSADEVIGKSVTILIPPDRLEEEPMILAQIHMGKRVEHFETKRRRKDGSLIDISLTISPIRNGHGVIVGASKIARRYHGKDDGSGATAAPRHRVKNLFALAGVVVSISRKSSASKNDVIENVQARLLALARAHELILSDRLLGPGNEEHVALLTLVQRILEPYVGGKAVTNLALLLHELATNAAKYGSLSVSEGRLDVVVNEEGDQVRIVWRETNGPAPSIRSTKGFGSRLEQGLARALDATIDRDWQETGLVVSVVISKAAICL